MRPIQNKIVAISLVTFFVLSLIALGFSPEAAASEPPELQSIPGTEIILRADERYTPNRIAPPEMPELGVQSTMIIVNYNGFPPEAQAAFQRAVDIWASLITSTVTIEVEANWKPMSYGVLGASRPLKLVGNFPNAPATWTWYPVGLANALSGYDLYPDTG
ncbi:MAG: hypothetical protein GY847_33215, partial [Proteobacteria bacterium]|nr:hypothetical protein [Pseudomonadota bacterium]